MWIDVLSAASYGEYNRKLAKLAGLQTAVYWSELLDIISRVVAKNTWTEEGYFNLDRAYVERQTSLTLEQQYECDTALSKLDVLVINKNDRNQIGVKCDNMIAILSENDPKNLKAISKTAKVGRAAKAEGKKLGITSRLKESLTDTDADVIAAYGDWIDTNYGRLNTVPQVKIFVDTVNSFTSNKATKIDVIKLATLHKYIDANWAINLYNQDHKTAATHEQKEFAGVSSIKF